ncbi:MAG: sugar-binding protein [Kiritimatiellia bacterium]
MLGVCAAAPALTMVAWAGLPVAPAPLARTGEAVQPVRLEVAPLDCGTNVWQRVAFVSGTKRVIVSDEDKSIDCNNPLRFGRLFIVNGRTAEGELRLTADQLWDTRVRAEDRLVVDEAAGTATWSRPYRRPDGLPAVFSYTLRGTSGGQVLVDWDMGLTQDEALAQTNALAVFSYFHVNGNVAPESEFGFGDRLHEMYPREKLLAENKKQIAFPLKTASDTFSFEPRDTLRTWRVIFPRAWVARMGVFDFAGDVRGTRIVRGTTYHYPIADFRRNNAFGHAVKGRIVIDLGRSAVPKIATAPAVGGIDFWGYDALHVPARPTRNLICNGSFEQALKHWRWEDWGAEYTKADKLREEVVAPGYAGGHCLVLRGTQPKAPALCSGTLPLEGGKPYVLSFYAKAASPKARKLVAYVRPSAVSRNGVYDSLRPKVKTPPAELVPGEDWKRIVIPFTADPGGMYIQMMPGWGTGADDEIFLDAFQVEAGTVATAYVDDPLVARLESPRAPFHDFRPGEKLDLALAVTAHAGATGRVRVRIENFYSETKFDETYAVSGGARVPLAVDPVRLGKGIFTVRLDYACAEGAAWTDYARFSVLAPLANRHATAQFYANHWWFLRPSRGEHYLRKFVEWGWGSGDGQRNYTLTKHALAAPMKALGVRNYVHPVAYEFPKGINTRVEVTPEYLADLEARGYETGLGADPDDNIFTYFNEEEDWSRRVGYEKHFACVQACARGVRRAFAERGLAPPKITESHGTSGYANGRNYDAMEGYLSTSVKHDARYDQIDIHPYFNIDGGILGGRDADIETQHLIDAMARHGYPSETPIMFTESFNMLPWRIPPWNCDTWGDSFRVNKPPTQARGVRECTMAGSQARLYLMALKFWPKVTLCHPWNCEPILDADFAPISHILAANTLGNLLPDPEWYGAAHPYRNIRGLCFRRKDKGDALMAVWTTDHDVEFGLKESPYVQMRLPRDAQFIDFEGNVRPVAWAERLRVPLTPAPLFIVSRDEKALLAALKTCVADDPSSALTVDIRPDAAGRVNLHLANVTDAPQRGQIEINSKPVAYDLAPRGRKVQPLADGIAAPMVKQTYRARVSSLLKPWDMAYFLVPRCGASPDWAQIPVQAFDNFMPDAGYRTKGLAAKFQCAYNASNFFVRVTVEDPDYVSVEASGKRFSPTALYAHDGALEVYFDAFGDARSQGEKDYDLNDSRYDFLGEHAHREHAVNWQLAQGTASATEEEIRAKLTRSFTRTETGYVYEIAFAERYLAPIDLTPGTVFGFGLSLHDYASDKTHAELSTSTRPGVPLNRRPFLTSLAVLQ